MEWGDALSDAAITPDLPNQDKAPSPEGTEKMNDCDVERNSDEISNAESEGFDPDGDYEASESDDVEMVDPVEAEIDEIMALDALDLEKEEDDTDQLLQELYMECRLVFSLATLTMELVFEVGQHLTKKDLVKFLIADKTIAGHPVVRLRLWQLRQKRRMLRWAMGQWMFWHRWQLPRELAPDMEEEDRLERAVLPYRRFNERALTDKMRIVESARVWGVLSSDLRDEIDGQDQVTDSDYDDIMQQ